MVPFYLLTVFQIPVVLNMAEDIGGENVYLKKKMKTDGHDQHFPMKKTNKVAVQGAEVPCSVWRWLALARSSCRCR
jgi:hypothetical protein